MKRMLTIVLILTGFLLSDAALAQQAENTVSFDQPLMQVFGEYACLAIPDVMGQVNVADIPKNQPRAPFLGLDQISVYPGWPINVPSWSHEGGIFCNMDADDDLEAVYYLGETVYALNLDGTAVPGWPQTTPGWFGNGAPALGDIDGDGDPEIVVTSIYTMTTGMIHAYELDGSLVSGFPINHGYSSRTPVLADLDGDGALEIITNKRFWPLGEWWVYYGNGTVFPGWPQPIGHVPSSSSAVGDITGDGVPEIVGESYDALYVWDTGGNLLPGFPFWMPYSAVNSYSSPVLADLDQDGLREIVFGTHLSGGGGYVFALENDGSQLPGWPKSTGWWIYGPPAVGYVDGDDVLDIVVGDQVGSPVPTNFIYGWNANGDQLAGFPIGPLNAINNQVALADLDGDGFPELIVDDNTMVTATYEGKYLAFHNDGTPVDGWPLLLQGCTIFNMPCLNDVNHDGLVDMLGAGCYASENWTNMYLWSTDYVYDPDAVTIPTFQYNVRHDGLFVGEPPAPPELVVTLTPVNPPIVIPAGGGSFDYTIEVENIGTSAGCFDGWIEVDLPTGTTVSPLILRENLSLAAGGIINRSMTQRVPGTAPAGVYTYRLETGSHPGTVYAWDEFDFTKSGTSDDLTVSGWDLFGWDEDVSGELKTQLMPERYGTLRNYPNPFNPTTTIGFRLPEASKVSLSVYDISGRQVATLIDGWRSAGHHVVTFDASGLPSGIYVYRLRTGDFAASGKMVLLK